MKKKREIMLLVILLAIGFAAVSTTLVLNGVIGLGESDDFKIIFTSASIDGTKRNDVISSDKTTINYETKTLTTVDEESELVYEATNTSRNYDAEVSIECNIVDNEGNRLEGNNIYVDMTYEPNGMTLLSGETKSGKVHARLLKAVTEPMDINIKCTLNATPKERDTLGNGYVDSNELGGTIMALDYEGGSGVEINTGKIWDLNIAPYVTKAVFESTLTPHETGTDFIYDISENQDGSVMAYVLENDDTTIGGNYADKGHIGYDLYIQSDGKVVANSGALFANFENLKTVEGLENLYTGNVTDMSYMFYNCSSLVSLDLSNFDTSNVTIMVEMFSDCMRLTTLDLSSFDTSKVTNMSDMFFECSSLTTLDLSNFNTSNVTSMAGIFSYCDNLTNIKLSNFNTNNVTDMSSMFFGCESLKDLNIRNFETSNVTDMSYMFGNCTSLTTLDVSNFNTSNVTDMIYMFHGCSNLATLDISGFHISKTTNVGNMFLQCKDELVIKVKDSATQDWVLALSDSDRPAAWTTENVIIKEA